MVRGDLETVEWRGEVRLSMILPPAPNCDDAGRRAPVDALEGGRRAGGGE